MNSNVNPVVATIVILLVLVCSGIWMWGTGRAEEISGPSEILTDPAGHLYIQLHNQLLEHDENGAFVRRHDLGELGVEQMLGGLDFFSNGDILMRRGPDSRGFLDNLRAFQRHTNTSSIISADPASGIHRCNLRTHECIPFGTPTIDFKATFSVFIDRRNDDVYISDTSRQLLRKFSSTGDELASPAKGFRFPNHLLLHDDMLIVADTNQHTIQIVSAKTDTFGNPLNAMNVTPVEARNSGHEWPSHFLRVGNEWWVNNMSSAMDQGGIYVFDDHWQFVRILSLPRNADPISMLAFNGDILITDWNNFRVHRLSASGTARHDFSSEGLNLLYEESRAARLKFLMITWSTIALLVGIAVILVVKGTSPPDSEIAPTDGSSVENFDNADFDKRVWLEPNPDSVKRLHRGLIIAGVLLAGVAGLSFYVGIVINADFLSFELILQGLGALTIYFLFVWIGRVNFGTAIGLYRDRITLRDHTGHEVSHSLQDAIYDGNMIATPDMAVALGNERMPIYDRDAITSLFLPRIQTAQQVSVWTMQSALIRMRHPLGILNVLGFIALAGFLVWMLVDAYS